MKNSYKNSTDNGSPPNKKLRLCPPQGATAGMSLTDSSDEERPSFSSFSNVGHMESRDGEGMHGGLGSEGMHGGLGAEGMHGGLGAEGMHGGLEAKPASPTSLRIEGSASSAEQPQYSKTAAKLMAKMGYVEGKGLGKNAQGRVKIVEASLHKGQRGLGHEAKGFKKEDVGWDFEKEEVELDEDIEWIPTNAQPIPQLDEMRGWMRVGPKKRLIDDECTFCPEHALAKVIECKSVFDNLEDEEMRRARTRSNPYETIRGVIFQNRAAMKMANMDAKTDWMFTNPRDSKGLPLVGAEELLYFADICAGPGGFSEYVLWRKKWDAKGFGFTLKGACDFKLDEFFAASSELFEPHYGVKGDNGEGDGDIYRSDNLRAFRQFVWDSTGGAGLHFVMADGGFSVEGQENIQEILSKRLYLCQFMCALSVLRVGGHFVCKLFDIFTPFSVGLVYLMYRAFTEVSIFKPVTSRPANSERYIICKGLRPDSHDIHDYMSEVNLRMEETFSRVLSDRDVVEVVPLEIMEEDKDFFSYIYDSNEILGMKQAQALVKIQTFAQNSDLHEMRQAETRAKLLKNWIVPDKLRTAPDRSEKGPAKFESLTEGCDLSLHQDPLPLSLDGLKNIHSIYDYRCFVMAAEERYFVASTGKQQVWRWTGQPNSKWQKVDIMNMRLELPRDTVLEGEFINEFRGEGKGQRRQMALHVFDALFLAGVSVMQLHYKERIQKLQKFVKAITRKSRTDLTHVRVKDIYKMEDLERLFERLDMKEVKGSGSRLPRLCYYRDSPATPQPQQHGQWEYSSTPEQPRFILPAALCLVKTEKDPWMKAYSKKGRSYYWFHTLKKCSVHVPPSECIGDYEFCRKNRKVWKWEDGVKVEDRQRHVDGKLSRDDILRFIKDKR